MTDFFELLKTENGIILACFIAGVFSLSYESLKSPASMICCVLLFAVIIGNIIVAICPTEIRPHVAIALMIVAGLGAIVRLVNGDHFGEDPMFSIKIGGSCCDEEIEKQKKIKK